MHLQPKQESKVNDDRGCCFQLMQTQLVLSTAGRYPQAQTKDLQHITKFPLLKLSMPSLERLHFQHCQIYQPKLGRLLRSNFGNHQLLLVLHGSAGMPLDSVCSNRKNQMISCHVDVQDNAALVQYLVRQPGVLEQRGSQRRLPLTIARDGRHKDIVMILIKSGASEL